MAASELDGKVVIVTGAGRGLGLAYALDLAARGAKIVVNTRPRASGKPASAEAVVEEIRRRGGQAVACPLAVEAEGSGEHLLEAALEGFGRLDALVNNAGAPEARPLHKQTLSDIRSVFEINYFGAVNVTLPVYRHLRDQGAGRIVMTTSAAGLHGVHGMAAYSSSKAALIALVRVISLEGASRGVHCNAVAPYALTGMTEAYVAEDVGRTMPPERVAPVVSWLLSDACPLNGETLVTGGGRVRRAVRVESRGLGFQPPESLDPAGLTEGLESLMDLTGWLQPTDGNNAFNTFMAHAPTRTISA